MATTVEPILDNTLDDPDHRSPLVLGNMDYADVTDKVCSIWEADKAPKVWWLVLIMAISLLMMLGACISHLLMKGVGVWGNNNPAY